MAEHKHTPTKKTIENLETNSSKKKKTDTRIQYEKITAESFKENFGQNLCNTTQEKLDSEFTNFKSKCEELVQP